jgi:hypothetical protein
LGRLFLSIHFNQYIQWYSYMCFIPLLYHCTYLDLHSACSLALLISSNCHLNHFDIPGLYLLITIYL